MKSNKLIRYKLTTQNLTTHNGLQWEVGIKKTVAKPAAELGSAGVFHFYDSPEIAVLMNPIHANIIDPKLWQVEIDAVVVHDGTKGGCHAMALLREIPLPVITTNQRVAFGIYCVLAITHNPEFALWAENWLSGKDRTAAGAGAAVCAGAAARAAAGAGTAARAAAAGSAAGSAAAYAAGAADAAVRAGARAAAGEDFLSLPAKKAMDIK